MSLSEAFDQYYEQFIKRLPMDDADFVASVNYFFHGNQKSTMNAEKTQADKATYFLDNVIKNNIDNCFVKLLNAMEQYGGTAEQLAREVKESIGQSMLLADAQLITYW